MFRLRVKDLSTGEIYSFTNKGENAIIQVSYCTSYFHFIVQYKTEEGCFKTKDLIYIFDDANPIDLLAINEDEKCDYWFE